MWGIPNIYIKMPGVKSKLKFVHRGRRNIQNAYTGGVHFKSKCAKRGGEKIISSPPLHIFKWNSPNQLTYYVYIIIIID